jgi:hypothetical protein
VLRERLAIPGQAFDSPVDVVPAVHRDAVWATSNSDTGLRFTAFVDGCPACASPPVTDLRGDDRVNTKAEDHRR